MFTRKKKTEASQPKEIKRSAGGTAGQMIKEVFLVHRAVDAKHAIPVSAFKDLKLSTTTISYTLTNFIEQDVVHQTEDEKYWFDQAQWDKLGKDVVKGYTMILAVPLILGLLFFLLIKVLF